MNALEVRDVSFAYGARQALCEVSFSLAPGRFAALLGPNGAGKSTLIALLTRLYAAPGLQAAEATLARRHVAEHHTWGRRGQQLNRVYQHILAA